jgi:membrane-associated phospholipid phosphatase
MYGLFDWDPPRGPGLPDETGIAAASSRLVRDWDPPRHASNWRGTLPGHALSAAESARGIVGAAFAPRPTTWPAQGAGDLPVEQRLAAWDLRVRVQLGLDSLLPLAQVVPTHPGGDIDKPADSVALTLPDGSALLTIMRPGHDRLLDTAPMYTDAQGLAGVEAAMALRRPRIDAILAADRELDLHLMESLALPVVRYPFTYTLLRVAMSWASQLVQAMKHAMAVPRPYHVWPGVRPMIEVPRHGSFPGGHAAQAAAAAVVLADLSDAALAARLGLGRLAQRIGEDRVVAGLHYPVDNGAGALLGTLLGQWLMLRSGGGGPLTRLVFDANHPAPVSTGGTVPVASAGGVLTTLRTLAEAEWR